MIAESEIWQVYTHGQVQETDTETLKQWVSEGYVKRTDKVKKGALTWIEAGRAPALRRVFSGEELVCEPAHDDAPVAPADVHDAFEQPAEAFRPQPAAAPPSACHFHPEAASKFVCRICHTGFCAACPNFVGTSKVPLCKVCGDLCKPVDEIVARSRHQEFQQSGFGFADLKRALRYPFGNVWSLVFGAGFYGLLLLAGFRGRLLASAVMFGCVSLVINKVAYGKLDKNFLPDFSEMSLWDDLIVPIFLGLGVTVVTIGPTILLVVALMFGWFGGSDAQLPNPAAAQQAQEEAFGSEDMQAIIDGTDPEREAEAARKLEQLHPGARVAKQAEESERGDAEVALGVMRQFLASPGLILILLLLSLGWALFYYPMALAVAGYTEDFWSVVNPLVGINTIKLMGLTYVKAFLMYLAVQVFGLVLGGVVGFVTAPFRMPFVGNLPAMFIDGMITFYIGLVVACLLGLAIFKSADRLGINVD